MSGTARYLVAKYISDLHRMEPRNIGVVLWAAGKVSARFLAEKPGELGAVDGRSLPGFVASSSAYKQWVHYWRDELGKNLPNGCSESRLEDLKNSSRGSFVLVDGGVLLEETASMFLPKMTDHLFHKLVETSGSEESKDPVLEQVANNWIRKLGLNRNEHFRSRYEVVCEIAPRVEERFEFSHAYTANGIERLYQRVPLTRRNSQMRRTVHDSAWMFEKVVQQGIVRCDQAVALVYATEELVNDPEVGRSLRVLSSVARVANLADESQAMHAFSCHSDEARKLVSCGGLARTTFESGWNEYLFDCKSTRSVEIESNKGETKMSKHCDDGLDGRCRDNDGEIRHKRRDTEVATLRKTYGDGFASGFRSDAHLGTVLDDAGVDTLSEYLKKKGR
jgi:hypothetical protein